MKGKIRIGTFIFLCGFLVLLDQYLKYLARLAPQKTSYLLTPWFGWEYFENPGIAFSLPFPAILTLVFTFAIILTLLTLFPKIHGGEMNKYKKCVAIITAGAISNFVDRVLFGATTDYLRLATGVFNIADILIIVGGVCLIRQLYPQKQ